MSRRDRRRPTPADVGTGLRDHVADPDWVGDGVGDRFGVETSLNPSSSHSGRGTGRGCVEAGKAW